MATHSSVVAWRIPGTEEPSGLPSMGSHRVGHDWSDLAAAAAAAGRLLESFRASSCPKNEASRDGSVLRNSKCTGFSVGDVKVLGLCKWSLCFPEWTVLLEKTLESPLDCREIQPVHPKGNQSWIFIGRTDAEAETPILWPPDAKNWLIWKDPDAGKDWSQEEKGNDRGWVGRMASPMQQWTWVWVNSGSWWCTGRPGVLQSMGRKESDMTERLNWTEW